MLNGFGTTLYGMTRIPGESGYIATKWFCLLWLPLVPLGSYIVFSERGTNLLIWSSKEYELVSLDGIYKPHLKAYIVTALVIIVMLFSLSYTGSKDTNDSDYITQGEREALSSNDEGLKLMGEKEYDRAIASFTKAIEAAPSYASLWSNRGIAYHEIGHNREAVRDFNKAISLDPLLIEVYSYRGDAFAELGIYDSAIIDYREAITLSPTHAKAHYGLGLALYYIDDYDGSLEALNSCLGLGYEPAYVHRDRGYVYLAKGDIEKANADADTALVVNPVMPGALLLKAMACDRAGNASSAREYYQRYVINASLDDSEIVVFAKDRIIELTP